jgi:hypothetical protein
MRIRFDRSRRAAVAFEDDCRLTGSPQS